MRELGGRKVGERESGRRREEIGKWRKGDRGKEEDG